MNNKIYIITGAALLTIAAFASGVAFTLYAVPSVEMIHQAVIVSGIPSEEACQPYLAPSTPL
jgi:hypothetical protein